MTAEPALVLAARQDVVTTVTLNRPEKRNALNIALLEGLTAVITTAENDPTQRILVLRGAGPVFCAGMDLAETAQSERTERSAELIERILHQLATTRLITIAAVHGAAVAGGAGLMTACDFALATQDSKIGYPEVRRGMVPALVLTFLRRQLRERDARELVLLGTLIPADRALALGLLNRVVPGTDALETETNSVIAALRQGAPETLVASKRLLAELWPRPIDADFHRAAAIHAAARTSAAAAEGIAAFLAHRPPGWAPDAKG